VKLGRLEFDLGSGRLLGADWYDNRDQSFDGARVTFADWWGRLEPRQWSWRLDVVGGSPVSADDADWNWRHDEPDVAGVFYSDRRVFPLRVDAGIVVTRTRNDDVAGELGGTGHESLTTLTAGVSGRRMGRAEGFAFELEGAFQAGRSGPDEHSASMAGAHVSYSFPTPLLARVRAGIEAASGDDDPNDGTSHAFRPLFPADMRDTLGMLSLVEQSNCIVFTVGGSFGPLEDFRVGADVRWVRLHHDTDSWNGVDPDGTQLGWELDVSGRYSFTTPSGKEVWIDGGIAIFEPEAALAGVATAIQAFYLQAAFRF
jgi:hypothetical protein